MLVNRSMPRCTVIPVLAYPDVKEAVHWLCGAFGFTLRLQIGDHRAQLNVGDGCVVIQKHNPMDETPFCSVMVRVVQLCSRPRTWPAMNSLTMLCEGDLTGPFDFDLLRQK